MNEPTPIDSITVSNRLQNVRLGVVHAVGVRATFRSPDFDRQLEAVLEERAAGLTDRLERTRIESRNMLRNGVYKPTGRGKPASEYLLRSSRDAGAYPRVNWPVDVCNYISLKNLLPISIWDLGAARAADFVVRLGRADEEYVFNTAGQVIVLRDLVVGCVQSSEDDDGRPIVNPVKDSMITKTHEDTEAVAAVVYAPATLADLDLATVCSEFADWLSLSAPRAVASFCLVEPDGMGSC